MNEIVNWFLLAGIKQDVRKSGFTTVLVDHLLKTKKEHKHLKKGGITIQTN